MVFSPPKTKKLPLKRDGLEDEISLWKDLF